MRIGNAVVAVCVAFFFHTSLGAPIDPLKIEHEILEKIGKHGTIINIFEASHDDESQRFKRDSPKVGGNANYDSKTGSFVVGGNVEIPMGDFGKAVAGYQKDLVSGNDFANGRGEVPLNPGSNNPLTFQGTSNTHLDSGSTNVGASLKGALQDNGGQWSLNYNRHLQSGADNIGVQYEKKLVNTVL